MVTTRTRRAPDLDLDRILYIISQHHEHSARIITENINDQTVIKENRFPKREGGCPVTLWQVEKIIKSINYLKIVIAPDEMTKFLIKERREFKGTGGVFNKVCQI